jgi:peptide/nickel transport system substrate-binding protein
VTSLRRAVTAFIACLVCASSTCRAADLKVGLALEPSSIDPHYHNFTPNNAVAQHFFDGIANFNEKQQPVPGLAQSWRTVDETTWEFTLRPGIHFQDGAPLTFDDIAFSVERAGHIPNSPSSFAMFATGMRFVQISDTVFQIKTARPNPIVPNNLANIMIVERRRAEGASNAEFNSGAATIGTGPYRFTGFVPGSRLTKVANPDYWGGKPEFDSVEIRFIKSGAPRVAALLSGDVDFIDAVPPPDLKRLRDDKRIVVTSGVTNRLIFLGFDQFRTDAPDLAGTDGKNPFLDARVRRAISKAVNRDALVERMMEGAAEPAGQMLPGFYFGTSPRLKPEPFDPDGARKLLAEAGYPQGFDVVLHGPNDRYVNDAQVAQAVAQMLTRVGVRVSVEALPGNVFFPEATTGGPNHTPKFSFILNGVNSGTGESSAGLRSALGTVDPARGFGAANRGRYSNPDFDTLIEQALATVDDTKRADLLARAIDLAIGKDVAIAPLYFQLSVWASRRDLSYTPRSDETTEVMSLHIAKQ